MKKHLFLLSALLLQVAAVSVSAQDNEYVDLGLSIKWATCNVGAATPLEVGNCYERSYMSQQGEDWRIPSNDEMIELLSYCTWNWVENADSCGFKVTSDIEGFTDRSIYLPVLKERTAIHEIVRTSDVGYRFEVVDSTDNYRGNYMTNYINDRDMPGYLDCGGHYPMPTMHKNGYPGLDDFHIRPVKPLDPQTKQNRVLPQVELRESYPARNVSKVIEVIDISEFEGLGIYTIDEALNAKFGLDLPWE
jgi:hypothetical protein